MRGVVVVGGGGGAVLRKPNTVQGLIDMSCLSGCEGCRLEPAGLHTEQYSGHVLRHSLTSGTIVIRLGPVLDFPL